MPTPTSRLALGLAAALLVSGTASAFPPGGNNNFQQYFQRALQQQQQQQQQLQRAIQQRNQQAIKQYQDAMKQQQEAYAKQIQELRDQGVTDEQLLEMQRQSILAMIPRHKHSAIKRQWATQDRLRERALERAKRTGQVPPDDNGGLDLGGGLEGIKLE